MAGVIIIVLSTIALMYLFAVVLGGVFDEIGFVASGTATLGHPEWLTLVLSRFNLVYISAVGICIATLVWGFLSAVSAADYTKEYY